MKERDTTKPIAASEYYEDYGVVLWWRVGSDGFPDDAPWCGRGTDSDFYEGDLVAGPLMLDNHRLILIEVKASQGDREALALCHLMPFYTHFSVLPEVRFDAL